jgi:D-glycero-D-manno-heptose 1,7-bisphosphate phosphatase
MLLQAEKDLGLDLAASWLIGDGLRDIEAGRAAGVGRLVLLDPVAEMVRRERDFTVVPSLAAAMALLARPEGG